MGGCTLFRSKLISGDVSAVKLTLDIPVQMSEQGPKTPHGRTDFLVPEI